MCGDYKATEFVLLKIIEPLQVMKTSRLKNSHINFLYPIVSYIQSELPLVNDIIFLLFDQPMEIYFFLSNR